VSSHSLDVLTRLSTVVPPALAARAAAWTAADTVVEPALSASVMLLRDGASGLETYLLHRHSRMPFAASMVVFPGGRVDPDDAVGGDPLRVCALRETFEETAVQLVDSDLLDWAHWTTPEIEPRRYETFFFLAPLPEGSEAKDVSGETDRAAWTAPSAALEAASRGDIALLPPTTSMLLELADLPDVAGALSAAVDRVIEPVLPRLTRDGSGWSFSYPSPS
jgi:8-oxo-dGTP pyrophosphatase MutT (NUDIX family)